MPTDTSVHAHNRPLKSTIGAPQTPTTDTVDDWQRRRIPATAASDGDSCRVPDDRSVTTSMTRSAESAKPDVASLIAPRMFDPRSGAMSHPAWESAGLRRDLTRGTRRWRQSWTSFADSPVARGAPGDKAPRQRMNQRGVAIPNCSEESFA